MIPRRIGVASATLACLALFLRRDCGYVVRRTRDIAAS
jgi:hypothetical protein